MESIIEDLTYLNNDNPPANQQGLPQYYREKLLILSDIIQRLITMKINLQSELNELEYWR